VTFHVTRLLCFVGSGLCDGLIPRLEETDPFCVPNYVGFRNIERSLPDHIRVVATYIKKCV